MDPHRDIRRELLERYRRLVRRLRGLHTDLDGYAPGEEQQVASAVGEIIEAATHELGLIRAAFERMAMEEYGRCGRCDRSIGLQRLQLLPYAVNCEVCAPGLDMDALKEIRVQHLGFRQLLRAIQDVMYGGDAQEAWAKAAVLALLGDLARELPEHFALEEKGGYLVGVLTTAPRLHRRAERLQRQHAELARSSGELADMARSMRAQPGLRAEVEKRFKELAVQLSAHEAAEDTLVREAFTDDVAAGD
jgi:RNA polymerase-binding transcription factor DksA